MSVSDMNPLGMFTADEGEDDWGDPVIPAIIPLDIRSNVNDDIGRDEEIVIKPEPQVIANDFHFDEMEYYSASPSLPSGEDDDDPGSDPDYTQDDEQENDDDHGHDGIQPIAWPKITLPPDADLDPILQLDHIEDMFDEEGYEIKAWKCRECSLSFQFFASYSKHNEREHPNGVQANWWDEDPVAALDRSYAKYFDSDDAEEDYSPVRRRKKVQRKKQTKSIRDHRPVLQTNGKRKRGRPPSNPSMIQDGEAAVAHSSKGSSSQAARTCTECGQEFGSKKKMELHSKRNHFLPYACTKCIRRFDSFKKYYVHSEMMHGILVQDDAKDQPSLSDAGESDPEDRRLPLDEILPDLFPCNLCPRHYVTNVALAGHKIRVHADEIPDLAVIETYKRVWKNRFDPDNIAKHEAALSKLGSTGMETKEITAEVFVEITAKRKKMLATATEDLDSVRVGPVLMPRSKKTLEELNELVKARAMRRRKKLLEQQGKDPESVAKPPRRRGTKKTIAQKLETHMKKLERRRVREREKREAARQAKNKTTIEVVYGPADEETERRRARRRERRAAARAEKKNNTFQVILADGTIADKPEDDVMNADTEPESEGDSEQEERDFFEGIPGPKKKKSKAKTSKDKPKSTSIFNTVYDGVKDFCRLCNQEFEDDRLTVLHLKDKHSTYTEEDKKMEDELLRNLLPESILEPRTEPVPGQEGSKYKKRYACEVCKKFFLWPYKLAAHREDKHQEKTFIDGVEISRICPEEAKRTEDQTIMCQHCGKTIRMRSIRLHVLRKHANQPFRKSFPCDQCDKSYPVAHHLFWHRRIQHTGAVLFTCELCGKEIKNPRTYKIHMKVHAGEMYPCKHCGEKFKSKQGLMNHEKRHTEKMNFECKYCAKKFWWQRDVSKHEKAVHSDGVILHDQIAINKQKDWEAESMSNAKKMRYLSDNPRAPNGSRKKGRPRKNDAHLEEEDESQPLSEAAVVLPQRTVTRSAAAAAKEAVVGKPTRKSKAQKKRELELEQMRAIESLDLEGLEEQVEYSVVQQDHLTTACQQILTIPHHQQAVNLNPHVPPHHLIHLQNNSCSSSNSSNNNHHHPHAAHASSSSSYNVLHAMQSTHAIAHHQQAAVNQMFLNSCMQQQQAQYQVPLIPGDCKLCRVRTNDLRAHYSEVHKVLPDVVQHFLN